MRVVHCPQAEKPGIQPVVGNTHGTHVEQVVSEDYSLLFVSSFQKILRGSQLTRYFESRNHADICVFDLSGIYIFKYLFPR